MSWKEIPDKNDDFILKEFKHFKDISGPYLCRILGDSPEYGDYRYFFLGSGGFLKFREKFFVVTNYHEVKDIPYEERLERIVVPIVSDGTAKAVLINQAEDKHIDLAAFEIPNTDVARFHPKNFVTDEKLETEPVNYLESVCNNVLLHGFPGERSIIDYDKKIIGITTFPYGTFAKGYDKDIDMIELDAAITGIDENGDVVNVPVFNGMSGSFAYTITEGLIPYKCFGVLSNGEKNAGSMWVIPINQVLTFIENSFF
ncbi:hypothetical protein [Bacillus marasmi]|uniref:hypothetical protein n=1 Tax=Bacillus marasmi TaxID=1926279 RepID=UPI0011CA7330|nr:hypothetical protein [Bacillus marasmi]